MCIKFSWCSLDLKWCHGRHRSVLFAGLSLWRAALLSIVTTMALTSYLLFTLAFLHLVISQTIPLSARLTTPTCLQAHQRTNSTVPNTARILSSAVPDACNPTLESVSTSGSRLIESYQIDSYGFNISHNMTISRDIAPPLDCPAVFNAIIASCVQNASGVVFLGGWMLQGAKNYSISNIKIPEDRLPYLSLFLPGPSSSLRRTGLSLSRSIKGTSRSLSSGILVYPSSSISRWSYQWQSATMLASSDGPSSGSRTGATGLSHSNTSSTFVLTRSASRTNTNLGSGILTSRSGSLGSYTTAAITSTKSGGEAVSSSAFSDSYSKNISAHPLSTGQLPTVVGSSALSAQTFYTTNSAHISSSASGSTVATSESSSADSSSTLATTIAPLPSFTMPPSGISIVPTSAAAANEGIALGGFLLLFSKRVHGVDLTIPTVKAEVIKDVDSIIIITHDLFKDLGGGVVTGSCGGGSKTRRLLNPFRDLEKLAGDITKIIGCANEVLNSLKDNLEEAVLDLELIDDLLADLGILADEADPDDGDDPSPSASKDIASRTTSVNTETSPFSSTRTSSFTSSASSSSASSVTGCLGCCPSDIPILPTTGTPAVTAAPTDFDPDGLDKRAMPERFQQMAKRRLDNPVPKINNCILRTPNNWPVTTPAFPGGYAFWKLETDGVLGSLTTVSRYYRSTNIGVPACTPTIARISAQEWTFGQSGPVPAENDKVSIDHAYEVGFLKSFMQSIIDQPDGMTCSDANSQFFDTGSCPDNRLQPIFGSLPSYANPDFIAMSQWLNGVAKGWVSNSVPNLSTATAVKSI